MNAHTGITQHATHEKRADYHCSLVAISGPSTPLPQSECLSIAFLAAILRKIGYPTFIDHGTFLNTEALVTRILSKNPNFVGISVFTETWKECIRLCQQIRKHRPSIHICLGGHLPSFRWKEILTEFPFVDSIVIGEGDETLPELLSRLLDEKSLMSCGGLAFRNGDGIHFTGMRAPIEDLDQIPFPVRDQMQELGISAARVITSRGCTGSCSFCSWPSFRKLMGCKTWRGRSVDSILQELHQLKKQSVTTVSFVDSTFEDPGRFGKQRIGELAKAIIDENMELTFYIWSKVGSFTHDDRVLLTLLKKAGLSRVFFGMETCDAHELKKYNKRQTIEESKATYALFSDLAISQWFGMIPFSPYTTFDGFRRNLDFIKFAKQGYVWSSYTHRLMLFAGAGILDELERDNLLLRTYRYDDIFAYTYQDERIGQLQRTLESIQNENLQVLDNRLLNLTMSTGRISRRANDTQPAHNDETAAFLQKLAKLQEFIAHHYETIIREAVFLCETGKIRGQATMLRSKLLGNGFLAEYESTLRSIESLSRFSSQKEAADGTT